MEGPIRRGQFSIGALLIAIAAIALLVQPSQHAVNVFQGHCFAAAEIVPDGGTVMTGATVVRANAMRGTWIDWLRQAVWLKRSASHAQQELRLLPRILIQDQDEVILIQKWPQIGQAIARKGQP